MTYLGAGVLAEDPEDGHLSGDRLAGAGRRTQQHVDVIVVERVEDLRLHRVKVGELVERLQLGVVKGGQRQRLQIQELCKKTPAQSSMQVRTPVRMGRRC